MVECFSLFRRALNRWKATPKAKRSRRDDEEFSLKPYCFIPRAAKVSAGAGSWCAVEKFEPRESNY